VRESQKTGSPMPQALLRSPRMVRRKPGTLGPLLLGRILTAPVLAVFAGLLGFVVLERGLSGSGARSKLTEESNITSSTNSIDPLSPAAMKCCWMNTGHFALGRR